MHLYNSLYLSPLFSLWWYDYPAIYTSVCIRFGMWKIWWISSGVWSFVDCRVIQKLGKEHKRENCCWKLMKSPANVKVISHHYKSNFFCPVWVYCNNNLAEVGGTFEEVLLLSLDPDRKSQFVSSMSLHLLHMLGIMILIY